LPAGGAKYNAINDVGGPCPRSLILSGHELDANIAFLGFQQLDWIIRMGLISFFCAFGRTPLVARFFETILTFSAHSGRT